jgi:predicted DNA-binding protein (UPF0251 family)
MRATTPGQVSGNGRMRMMSESGVRNTDVAMTAEDIAQLRELHERSGSSLVEAAAALGIHPRTFTRLLAGLKVAFITAQYVRNTLPRTLQNLRRKQRVDRTG